MDSNLDHEAIISNELAREDSKREQIDHKIRQETADSMKKDSYFVRKLSQNKKENKTQDIKINSRPNLTVITNNKPYTLDQIMRLETQEFGHKVRRVPKEKVNKYLEKENKLKDVNNSRYDNIYQEALIYGTQSGLYYRGTNLKNFIDKYDSNLSKAFNFTPLMLAKGKVVPAVVLESSKTTQNSDRYTLRSTDSSFRIVEQVRVVNNPITWRQYIMLDMPKPSQPNEQLLPLNEEEDHHWKLGISQGWEVGVSQANSIYLENIRKLQRDYVGMVRFHVMLKRGLLTNPVTSLVSLGVTGEEDETMNINETIFKIDRITKFNKDADSWKALNELSSLID